MVGLLAISSITNGFVFEKTDLLEWKIAESKVILGTRNVDIIYKPIPNCKVQDTADWTNELDYKKTAYQGLQVIALWDSMTQVNHQH